MTCVPKTPAVQALQSTTATTSTTYLVPGNKVSPVHLFLLPSNLLPWCNPVVEHGDQAAVVACLHQARPTENQGECAAVPCESKTTRQVYVRHMLETQHRCKNAGKRDGMKEAESP